MNPRWEDVRGKSVGLNTLISMPHFTSPACTGRGAGQGAELALDRTTKSPAAGFFLGPFPGVLGSTPP